MFDLYLLESHEVMYHVKFLRWMKTENLSLCLEWKGHLSVSAKFQTKKRKKWSRPAAGNSYIQLTNQIFYY